MSPRTLQVILCICLLLAACQPVGQQGTAAITGQFIQSTPGGADPPTQTPPAFPSPIPTATTAPSLIPSQEQVGDCSTVEHLQTDSTEAQQIIEESIQNFNAQYPTEYVGMAILHRVDRLGEWAVVQGSVSGEAKDVIVVRQTTQGYQIAERVTITSPLESPKELDERVVQPLLQKIPEAPPALLTCLDQDWLLAVGYESEPSKVFRIAYVGTSDNTTDGASQINNIQSDGSNHNVLLSESMLILGLASPPGGDKLAFWSCPGSISQDCFSNGDLDVWAVSWDGSNLTNLTDDSAEGDSHPDWSPDGEQIVFDSWRTGKAEIYIMQADGSNVRPLTLGGEDNREPKWSPDGKWIAYHCRQDFNTRICVVSPSGQPAGAPISGTSPVWSPSSTAGGMRLAFLCFKDQQTDICTARPDGSELVNLTSSPYDEHSHAWSPDGSWLAFVSNMGNDIDIYKICVTCSGEPGAVRLTDEPRAVSWPAWSPDGEQVAYESAGDLLVVNADRTGAMYLTSGVFSPPMWRP